MTRTSRKPKILGERESRNGRKPERLESLDDGSDWNNWNDPGCFLHHNTVLVELCYTDKNENKIVVICKEIQMERLQSHI